MSRLQSFINYVSPLIGKNTDPVVTAAKFGTALALALGDGPEISDPRLERTGSYFRYQATIAFPGEETYTTFILRFKQKPKKQPPEYLLGVRLYDGDNFLLKDLTVSEEDTQKFVDNPRSLLNKACAEYIDDCTRNKIYMLRQQLQANYKSIQNIIDTF